MISGKYVHLIETHWDQIISRVIEQIRREPDLKHMQAVLASEARDWGEHLLEKLGHWLVTANQEDVAHHYELLGRIRCEQDVPLWECVRALAVIREKTLDYVEEHIMSHSSVELYAEEELVRRLGAFFDILLTHLVRGYESAWHRSVVVAAS